MYCQIKYFKDENMHIERKHVEVQGEHKEQHTAYLTRIIKPSHEANKAKSIQGRKGSRPQKPTGQRWWPTELGLVRPKPRIFIENPNLCTIAIVPGSVAIAYRTSHR
jgi:hypothetical protein